MMPWPTVVCCPVVIALVLVVQIGRSYDASPLARHQPELGPLGSGVPAGGNMVGVVVGDHRREAVGAQLRTELAARMELAARWRIDEVWRQAGNALQPFVLLV